MSRNYYRLGLAFTNEDTSTSAYSGDDWLEIVQPEWEDIDESGFGDWLEANNKTFPQVGGLAYIDAMFKLLAEYRSNCDEDGCLDVELQVHKSREDLPYRLVASWGELSEKYSHETTVTESIDVEMEESTTIQRTLTNQIGSASWDGSVFDAYGNEIEPPPEITLSGSTYSWSQKVIGTLRVKYTERHDAYVLTITPRESGEYDPENPETAYESTVRAFWQDADGDPHVETHEVDLPDLTGNCGSANINVSIGPGDDDDEQCVRHVIVVDPCDSTKIIEEYDEPMECPEVAE